jgi:hypothetical protein
VRAQLISISEAARLLGKARETVMKAAQGLTSKSGPKNANDANALMMSIYCGNQRAIWWEADEAFQRGEFEIELSEEVEGEE